MNEFLGKNGGEGKHTRRDFQSRGCDYFGLDRALTRLPK